MVPSAVPGSVMVMVRVEASAPACADIADLASPKSRIFTRPSRVTRMLAGFRSRCTIPAAWAAASPSAVCTARSSSLTGFSTCPSGEPSINSITR